VLDVSEYESITRQQMPQWREALRRYRTAIQA